MLGDGPLRVDVTLCQYRQGLFDIRNEALQDLRCMQAQDQASSSNISCQNQSGSCFGLAPQSSGIYWTGLLILLGCVGGAIVIRKARK